MKCDETDDTRLTSIDIESEEIETYEITTDLMSNNGNNNPNNTKSTTQEIETRSEIVTSNTGKVSIINLSNT